MRSVVMEMPANIPKSQMVKWVRRICTNCIWHTRWKRWKDGIFAQFSKCPVCSSRVEEELHWSTHKPRDDQ